MDGMSYGEKVAMSYALRNAKRRAERKPPEPKAGKPGPKPVLETSPLAGYVDKGTQSGLPWGSPAIEAPAGELHGRFSSGGSNMQLLVMPPGHGKTAVAVAAMGKVQQAEGRVPFVIAAPKAVVEGGGWQETICSYNAAHPGNEIWPHAITTHDKLANVLNDRRSRLPLLRELGESAVLVLDEAHAYKNPTSRRAKGLQKAGMWRRIGLTATPITNDALMDAASYLIMAGKYANKTDFLDRERLVGYVDAFNRLPMFVRDRETGGLVRNEALLERFREIRLELEPVVYQPDVVVPDAEMPDVEDVVVQLPYSEQLASDVESLTDAYRARMFGSAVELAQAMAERVCLDPGRLDRCAEIASGPSAVQPLVFFQHTAVRDALLERLGAEGLPCQVLDGSHPMSAVDLGARGPVLVQYRAGGEGVEFKMSNTSVFYENQYSFSCLHQARGRNVRRGTGHRVTRYSLVSQCLFDREVYGRVAMHAELSDETLAEIAEASLASRPKW